MCRLQVDVKPSCAGLEVAPFKAIQHDSKLDLCKQRAHFLTVFNIEDDSYHILSSLFVAVML